MRLLAILTIALIVTANSTSYCQDEYLDSLINIVEVAPNDSSKVNTLNEIGLEMSYSDPDEALNYIEDARNLAEELNYKKGLGYALKNQGLANDSKGEYAVALDYYEQALSIFRSINDENGEANILSNLGAVYFTLGNDSKALENYLNSLRIAEEINDINRITVLKINIGAVYSGNDNTLDRAIEYYKEAIESSLNLDDKYIRGYAFMNLGESQLLIKDYDEALKSLVNAQKIFLEENSDYDLAFTLNLIGKLYGETEYYKLAIEKIEEALEISIRIESDLDRVQSLKALGDVYRMQNDDPTALKYYREAITFAKDVGLDYELRDSYEGIYRSFANLNDYRNAFLYQSTYMALKDSLFNIETDDEIRGLQFAYDLDKKQAEIDLQTLEADRQRIISISTGVVGVLLLLAAIGLFNRYKFIQRTKKIIEEEKDRSDNLLHNILPHETAQELKEKGEAKARKYSSVSILFTDFKGFTSLAANMSPEELVNELNKFYKVFDTITTKYNIEKIKTIGDAYMAAGGLPVENDTHPVDVTLAALEMKDYIDGIKNERMKENKPYFEIRIGIHTGPVVAGIVGTKKFQYDIWGDTVNIASRMESNSEPGKVNISESTYNIIKDRFTCSFRGEIEAKNRGMLKMYFVEGSKPDQAVVEEFTPQETSA